MDSASKIPEPAPHSPNRIITRRMSNREIFNELKIIILECINDTVILDGRTISWLAHLEKVYFDQDERLTTNQRGIALDIVKKFYDKEIHKLELPEPYREREVNRNLLKKFLANRSIWERSYFTEAEKIYLESLSKSGGLELLSSNKYNKALLLVDNARRREKIDTHIKVIENKLDSKDSSEEPLEEFLNLIEEVLDIEWLSDYEIFYDNIDDFILHIDSDTSGKGTDRDRLLNLAEKIERKFGRKFGERLIGLLNKKSFAHSDYNETFCVDLLLKASRSNPNTLDFLFDSLSQAKSSKKLIVEFKLTSEAAREKICQFFDFSINLSV